MEDPTRRAIESLPFMTNTPFTPSEWSMGSGIEVVSASGRSYTIVITAIEDDVVEGVISIVNRKWRLKKEEWCNVILRPEKGMIKVHTRT